MKRKLIIITIAILIVILFIILFYTYKKIKKGNNTIKSVNDLIEYIFNINSYEAKIKVLINSNKTTNAYEFQQYYMAPNYYKQIANSPDDLNGIEIEYNDNKLTIKNTIIGINKIYNDYNNIASNELWLNTFLHKCKKDGYTIKEENNEIYIIANNNILYLDKNTNLPKKLEIKDNNNKTKIYIEYIEIKLNNIQ